MATDKAPERASSRVILHCDCNNFFASVELLSHPELHDKPVAVAGDTESRHGIILAKNMIAKRFGVKTAETVWQARQKCPGLVLLPPHHDRYVAFSERINRIYLDYTDQVEPFSVDESFLDVTGSRALFGSGKEIADTLRKRIREEIGITISAGVSFNKTWAKMGSDYKKPDATTVISRENAEEILYPQPIENMLYVGASAAQVLKRNGITTIGHLAAASPDALFRMLGKSGLSLSRAARGADESPVRVYGDTDEARSISNSRTYPRDLVGQAECEKALLALSESVGTRLRAHGLKCRTVQVQIKDSDLKVISRQRTLSLPTSSTDRIYREACAILAASWPENRPVRLFSVGVDHLTGEDEQMPVQLSMLETETDQLAQEDAKREQLEKTIDDLRRRFGPQSVLRGRVADTKTKKEQ